MPEGFVYLNDTSQYARLGTTAHDGHPCLVLNSGKVETIKGYKQMVDRSEVFYDMTILAGGDAVITRTRKIYGSSFEQRNRMFTEMPAEERRRYHLEAVAAISQSAQPNGDLVTDYSSYPGTETLSVKIARFAVRDGNHLYFKLPQVLGNLLSLGSDKRTNPLYLASPIRSRIVTRINLPKEFENVQIAPALAKPLDWSPPGASGKVAIRAIYVQTENGRHQITITQEADLSPGVFEAADYDNLLDLVRTLSHPESRTLMLKKVPKVVDTKKPGKVGKAGK